MLVGEAVSAYFRKRSVGAYAQNGVDSGVADQKRAAVQLRVRFGRVKQSRPR